MPKPAHARRCEQLKESVKQRIRAGNSWQDLERIVRAAPKRDRDGLRESLVEILAVAAVHDRIGGSKTVLAQPMRRRAKQLKSLPAQLRTVASHAKWLDESEDSGLDGWAVFAPGGIGSRHPNAADWCSPDLIRAMQESADRAEYVAREMSVYTRRGIKCDRWLDVKILTDLVSKHARRNFYPELARLLVDAYEAAGLHRCFSADQIRKHVERLPDI